MDYVHGTTALELSAAAGNFMHVPAQYVDHYYAQIAQIMVELASLRFERIGSIFCDLSSGDIDKVEIGPIAQIGEGPYETAQKFFTRYPAAIAKTLYNDPVASDSGGAEVIRRVPHLCGAREISTSHLKSYGLVNLELGTHNVLVNATYDILSVIDWDSVVAAPSAVLHQFPWCVGADPGIPGIGPLMVFGDWDGRMEMCRKFANVLGQASDIRVKQGKEPTFSAIDFFSKEALAFRALAYFRVKQRWVDEHWVPGLDWLQRCSDEELLDWYGMGDSVPNDTESVKHRKAP